MEGGRRGKQNIETDFKEEIVIDVEEEEICQLKDEWTTDSNDVGTTEESQTDEDYERYALFQTPQGINLRYKFP